MIISDTPQEKNVVARWRPNQKMTVHRAYTTNVPSPGGGIYTATTACGKILQNWDEWHLKGLDLTDTRQFDLCPTCFTRRGIQP